MFDTSCMKNYLEEIYGEKTQNKLEVYGMHLNFKFTYNIRILCIINFILTINIYIKKILMINIFYYFKKIKMSP
jgi:hypothetical protein